VSDVDSDRALVERANRGAADALEQLYLRHRNWVITVAYRFTGEREEALDVLQDTFAYLFGKFPGFVLNARLRTFLYPVVKNLCIDRLRKRHPTLDVDALADHLPAPLAPADADLHRLLQRVSPHAREVLLLRFVDDLSLEQIATALNLPLGTVKSRLHHALETLRREMVMTGNAKPAR
jgi:RNA polymerase sigma-70 factor (ECF subfamily)